MQSKQPSNLKGVDGEEEDELEAFMHQNET